MSSAESLPVTLVTTILNEAKSLHSFLKSIEEQRSPPQEVIIVDAGSTDLSWTIVSDWATSVPFKVKLIKAPNTNIARGRNLGIAQASFNCIAVTDAGTILDRSWLRAITNPIIRNEAEVVAGAFTPTGASLIQRFIASYSTLTLQELSSQNPPMPSSRSIAFTQESWKSVSGYPEWLDYAEDLYFDEQLVKLGVRIRFAPHAIVAWNGRPSIVAFFKQYRTYAKWEIFGGLRRKSHSIRLLFYGSGLLAYVFPKANRQRRATRLIIWTGFWLTGQTRYLKRIRTHRTTRNDMLALQLVASLCLSVIADAARLTGVFLGIRERYRRQRR